MTRAVKNFFLLLILLVLAFPFAQTMHPFFKEKEIRGYFYPVPKPALKYFTWKRWFSGEFQEETSRRIENHIGLRPYLYGLRNQVDFSLFRLSHAEGFITARKLYMYEEDYIYEYTGRSFIGEKPLLKKLSRLQDVSDSLKAHGISLILVFEPGKASFYPEYIPKHYRVDQKTISNYDFLTSELKGMNIPFLDLNRYFCNSKDTSRYPLFPKYGMHWSTYGAVLAADTLARFIEKVTGRSLPDIQVGKINLSDTPVWPDNDIANLLNLLLPLPKSTLAYPEVKVEKKPSDNPPSLLVIADSYYLNLVEGIAKDLFASQEYWYYNKKLYPHHNDIPPVLVDKTDLQKKFSGFNVILLMMSEINLHYGFWNFADEAYLAFHPGVKDDQLYQLENEIRNSRDWFRFMVKKSGSQGVGVEEMVTRDAKFVLFRDFSSLPDKSHSDSVYYYIELIRNSPEWLAMVTQKAEERKLPLDSMLLRDAEYMVGQSKGNH